MEQEYITAEQCHRFHQDLGQSITRIETKVNSMDEKMDVGAICLTSVKTTVAVHDKIMWILIGTVMTMAGATLWGLMTAKPAIPIEWQAKNLDALERIASKIEVMSQKQNGDKP